MIDQYVDREIDIILIKRAGIKELVMTALPDKNEELSPLFYRLVHHIKEHEAKVVKMDIFGIHDAFFECSKAIVEKMGYIKWPITYVVDNNGSGKRIAGIHVHAVTGMDVETIVLNSSPLGRLFEDTFAEYCILGNVQPENLSVPPKDQAQKTLENIEKGLELAGMGMKNLVRTWFFNDDILRWYKEFNSVRTKFYREKSVFDGLLPASTGMGGNNPARAALMACALAVRLKNDKITVKEVPSPLQCPASDYGSSFSRAVEISNPDYRRLFVSGTASIDPSGKTAHVGDIDAQISLTMEIVEAILKYRGMGYADVSRAFAYYKPTVEIDDQVFEKSCDKYGLPITRVIVVQNDICRDELLFEIEVDAVSAT